MDKALNFCLDVSREKAIGEAKNLGLASIGRYWKESGVQKTRILKFGPRILIINGGRRIRN